MPILAVTVVAPRPTAFASPASLTETAVVSSEVHRASDVTSRELPSPYLPEAVSRAKLPDPTAEYRGLTSIATSSVASARSGRKATSTQ